MSKLKVLVAVMAVVALLLVPTAALAAMPRMPAVFIGTAYLDDVAVPAGTLVTAWVEGAEAGRDDTDAAGAFYLRVDGRHDGNIVLFKVGAYDALPIGTVVREGHTLHPFNLHAFTDPPAAVLPVGIALTPSEGFVTTVSGIGFTPGSVITLTWAGAAITTIPPVVTAEADETFLAIVAAPTAVPGGYMIEATDAVGRSDDAAFTVPDLTGAEGPEGPQGPKGDTGDR
ncbi:hypothetical protein M1N79_02780, partial [Dehalococcoidia bacterium]|nr:hypothetical protein [Dehalococcoidia bacterium]